MIIRSGLIKNDDSVDFREFSKHWKDVHGPLARIVPRMRAYSQNHIRKTLASVEQFGFHRVDGISQLRFDSLAACFQTLANIQSASRPSLRLPL